MKGNPVLYKTLVMGVIVLFVGVGIQPAIAITSNVDDNIKNLKDCKYQEDIPVIRAIRCIILFIGMAIVSSIYDKLEDYDNNPIIGMFTAVLLLIYAFMGVRFLCLSGWTP